MSGARRYDAIVVGGGHNGLVAAAYLARAGQSVCLLERRELVGGAAVTEELWPGYRLSRASYVVSLLQPRIVDELELARHGYRVTTLDPAVFFPFADGTHLFEWAEPTRRQAALARISPADAEAYPAYSRAVAEVADLVRPLLLSPPPGALRGPGDLLDYLRIGLRGTAARRQLAALTDLMTLSVADYLRRFFSHPKVLGVLCGSGVIGAWAGPETPGTAYVLLHHVIGEVNGMAGAWGIPQGGMGAVSQAIASAARAAGAELRTGAAVTAIRSRGGRALGVTLATGEELDADSVLCGIHPRTALLDLVGEPALPPEVVEDLRHYRSRSGVVKINAVLSELPRFTCLEGAGEPPARVVEFMLHDSLDEVERAWDDCKRGEASRRPFVDACLHSVVDPTVVPAGSGHHTLSLFTQYGPYALADGRSWDDEREAYARRVFELIGERAPNVPGAVLHHEVLAPPDLEREFGLVGGNIFHGEMTLDQLFAFRPALGAGSYRTPLAGLYLCGSGSHPGGGVMGAPGYLGARTVLRDAQLRRWRSRLQR